MIGVLFLMLGIFVACFFNDLINKYIKDPIFYFFNFQISIKSFIIMFNLCFASALMEHLIKGISIALMRK